MYPTHIIVSTGKPHSRTVHISWYPLPILPILSKITPITSFISLCIGLGEVLASNCMTYTPPFPYTWTFSLYPVACHKKNLPLPQNLMNISPMSIHIHTSSTLIFERVYDVNTQSRNLNSEVTYISSTYIYMMEKSA